MVSALDLLSGGLVSSGCTFRGGNVIAAAAMGLIGSKQWITNASAAQLCFAGGGCQQMSGQLQLATGGAVMIFFVSLNATQVVTSLDFDIQKATTGLEECSAHITLSTLHTQTTNYPSKPQQFENQSFVNSRLFTARCKRLGLAAL